MENNANDSGPKDLVNELLEGRDLTKKLQLVFNNEPQSSLINEAYGLLANNILAKFERSLQILQYDPTNPSQFQRVTGTTDSPNSFSGSPKSQDSDGDFKDPIDHKDDSKKRRIHPRVIKRVQGSTSSGLEGPIEDSYNWRKYGQKDILGADYPRAYYRCTYRNLHKCLATKQVQRANDDPGFFEVTYRGKHTCSQACSSSSSSFPNNLTPKLEPTETLANSPQQPLSHQPKNIIWDFNRDNHLEDIKPIITNNINHSKPFSFSFPCSSNTLLVADHTQQIPTSIMHNYCDNFVSHGNFPTKTSTYTYQSPSSSLMIKSNFNDHPQGAFPQEVVHHLSSTSATNSLAIAPSELTYDHQGEFDDDLIASNPHFFQ